MERIRMIARICHEANRFYCLSLGDRAQRDWYRCPIWQRVSAIEGVRFIEENPDAWAHDSHDNWLKCKEALGWVYADVKNVNKKQHPCMVPYHKLPSSEKHKNHLFVGICRALLPHNV